MSIWQFKSAAADALMIHLEPRIELTINARVQQLARSLPTQFPWLLEVVPSYHSLLLYYDVLQCDEKQVREQLKPVVDALLQEPLSMGAQGKLHTIEVCYDPDLGADLNHIAADFPGGIDDVIRLHTAPTYHVYALGFAPGFAYMGDVVEALRRERHATPRQRVPRGSVAIAGQQTALYPQTSPGGWQLLGRACRWPQLHAGDHVRFVAIARDVYEQQRREFGDDA